MLRRWFNTPIMVWECDWMPRELKKVPKNSTYSAFPRQLSSVCVQVCLDCWYVHHRYLCLWKTNVCFSWIKHGPQKWRWPNLFQLPISSYASEGTASSTFWLPQGGTVEADRSSRSITVFLTLQGINKKPPWEKENHLQTWFLMGYVSSLEGTPPRDFADSGVLSL